MTKTWIISFLNLLVQKDKLVIQEDEQFIRKLLSSSSSDDVHCNRQNLVIVNFSVIWIVFIAVWLLPKSSFVIGCSSILLAIVILLVNAGWLRYWWTERCYKHHLGSTACLLKEFKAISKKIMKLIEEEEIVYWKYPELNSSEVLFNLKLKIRDELKEMFIATRNMCQDFKNIPDSVCNLEDDSSCLSQLPLDTFDQLLTESEPTTNQLKALTKLVTLQNSELFRKLLTFLAFSNNSIMLPMMKKLMTACRCQIVVLRRQYVYVRSYFHPQESDITKRPNDNFSELDCLINEARIATSAAYTLLKKSSESVADEALVMNLVESARKELLKAAETAQHIRDKYSTNTSATDQLHQPLLKPVSPETLLKVDQEESSEQSLDYQVFEADEADDNVTNLAVTGDDFDFNGKIGISIRMNEDLRCALLKKAEEHQERIAQALHLPVNEVSANYFSGQEGTKKESERLQREVESREDVNERMNPFNSTLLAKLVVEGNRKNVNWKEDTFGSSSSCSEGEEKEDESNVKKVHE